MEAETGQFSSRAIDKPGLPVIEQGRGNLAVLIVPVLGLVGLAPFKYLMTYVCSLNGLFLNNFTDLTNLWNETSFKLLFNFRLVMVY